jgi:PAS domain S-box-containing protein
MDRSLKLLIVEDFIDDAALLVMRLRQDGYDVDYERVYNAEQMAQALARRQDWDLVISDYSLPQFSAPMALTVLQQSGLDIPFIIVSGTIGEERAVATMRSGARDFILKNDLRRLTPVIERELRESRARATRRKTEQALKGSEQRYRQIVNTAQEGIWVVDASDDTVFVNRYMAQMLDYAEYEMIGRPLSDFLHSDRSTTDAAARGFGKTGDCQFHRRDGEVVWAIVSSSEMLDENGNYAGALGMVTDVTDRKHAEQERERLVNELRDAVRARDEFLSVASHELKTPITSVKLQLQTIIRQAVTGRETLSAPVRAKLEAANRQVNRLTQLIDELLDVTRMTNKKLSYEFSDTDLAGVVHEVALRFAEQAKAAGVEISVHTPGPVDGWWDHLRLEQVVANLISNSIRYGGQGPVEVSLTADHEQATLHVRDYGSGIPKEVQGRIFDRFEQAPTARKVGGLGLGLYIVKQIVEAHHGSVRVESEPGHGSMFAVTLPRGRKAASGNIST